MSTTQASRSPNAQRAPDLHLVLGIKGGSGKTTFAVALSDYVAHRCGQKLFTIETDTANSDVDDTFGGDESGHIRSVRYKLDGGREGWIALYDAVEGNHDRTVIINSGARNDEALEYSVYEGYMDALYASPRRVLTWFMLTANPRTLDLLGFYHKLLTEQFGGALPGPIHVVMNAGEGDRRDFSHYTTSKFPALLKAAGGHNITMPQLDLKVIEMMEAQDLDFTRVKQRITAGRRIGLDRWLNTLYAQIAAALDAE